MANNKTLIKAIERKKRQIIKLQRRVRYSKTDSWIQAKKDIETKQLEILRMEQQIIFNQVAYGHTANKRE